MTDLGKCEFCFHNVGQGLFYSGHIGGLRFIYDCGADPATNATSLVCRYAKAVNHEAGPNEHVVFLSHLHKDHVSGLEAILDLIKVCHVIMPYIAPAERLLLACAAPNVPTWYLDLIRNPVGFLREKGVDRVTLIKRSRPDKHEGPYGGRIPGQEAPDLLDLGGLADLEESEIQAILDIESEVGNDWSGENKPVIKDHQGSIKYRQVWEFVPYCYEVEELLLEEFRRCIVENGFDLSRDFVRVLQSKRDRDKLRRCYQRLVRAHSGSDDLNLTTMALWHGPANSEAVEIKWGTGYCYADNPVAKLAYAIAQCTLERPCSFVSALGWREHCAQLLTGDLDLKRTYGELRKHLGDRLERVGICLVPHHGSANNWNDIILGDARWCQAWVVSAGLRNRYGHPATGVIRGIIATGRTVCWAHERAATVIELNVTGGDESGPG